MGSIILSIIVGLIVLTVSWKYRLWGIALVLLLLPTYVIRFQIGWLPVTMLEVSVLALFSATFFHSDGIRELLAVLRRKDVLLIGGVFLAAGGIALLTAPYLTPALGLFKAYMVEPVLFAWVILATIKRPEDWYVLFWSLMISGAVVALVAVAQYVVGWGIPDPWSAQPGRRATAWYGFPNAVGLYIAPLLSLVLAVLFHGKELITKHRVLLIVIAALMGAALIASRVDGGLIAVGAVFVMLLAFSKWKWAAVAIVATAILRVFTHEPTREIVLFQDVSGDVRLAVWRGTWNLLQYNPLFGSGLASFPFVYEFFRLPSHVENLQYPHNIFLNYWSELGIVGLLWIIGILAFLFFVAVQSRREHSLRAMVLGSVVLCVLVYGLVDVPTMKNDLALLLWTWIALALCLRKPKHDIVQSL